MDDGHFLSFGTIFAGITFIVIALVGGTIVYLSIREWSKKKKDQD